jgi:hypothetical protein
MHHSATLSPREAKGKVSRFRRLKFLNFRPRFCRGEQVRGEKSTWV